MSNGSINLSDAFSGRVDGWRVGKNTGDRDAYSHQKLDVGRARQLARTDPYAKNATRIHRDSVIGARFRLRLEPEADLLGVSHDAAAEWARDTELKFEAWAESVFFDCDASRKQHFTGLLWTLHDNEFVDGESFAAIEYKPGIGKYQTCVKIINPDRVCDPEGPGKYIPRGGRQIRSGVEVDRDMAPIAYHIRNKHPHDHYAYGGHQHYRDISWKRVKRSYPWGRPKIIHSFDQSRPDLTRGVSAFTASIGEMKMLQEFSASELESAGVQAAYAAVIETELDFDKAMEVIGQKDSAPEWNGNNLTAAFMDHMQQVAPYHKAANVSFNGSKIPHLLPGEKLQFPTSSHPSTSFDPFEKAFLRRLAAGLGVDYASLSRNYADVSYSAARLSLAECWRSYLARRNQFIKRVAMQILYCWLEEAIAIGEVDVLGGGDWLDARHFLCLGTFTSWGKPLVDAEKERKADLIGQQMGILTAQDMAGSYDGQDWQSQFRQVAREKSEKEKLGILPEDLDPSLRYNLGADNQGDTNNAQTGPGGTNNE